MKITNIISRTPVQIYFDTVGYEATTGESHTCSISVLAYVDFKNRIVDIPSDKDRAWISDKEEFDRKVFEYFEDSSRSDEIEVPQEIQQHMIRVQHTATHKMQEIKESNDRAI